MIVNNQKATAKNAEQMINEAWAPMITRTTGVKDPEKLAWMSQLAHNTAKSLNESAPEMGANAFSEFGGAYAPYNNLYNTLGVGNVVAPKAAAMTGAQQADDKILGSGDKFPALLPLAMKVAAKTIGFELVNTTPLQGPSGVLPYMDYVYAGSKQPYGATPAFDRMSANPHVYNKARMATDSSTMAFPDGSKVNGKAAWRLYGLPHAFKAALVNDASTPVALRKYQLEEDGLVAGSRFENAHLVVEFIGWSRIDGDPMFKVVDGDQSLGETFLNGPVTFTNDKVGAIQLQGAKLISMLEDQLLGFAGAGDHDEDAWIGTYQDGKTLYEPMSRATGEMTPARQISLQLFTKNIQVGTIQVACAVTQEQVTDLQKQWGIDVLKIVENAGINDLSQTINRHITSRLFALGWKNHARMVEVEGLEACLNMTFQPFNPAKDPAQDLDFAEYAIPEGEYLDQEQRYASQRMVALPLMPMGVIEGANFENRDTLIKRIFTNILAASNWIQQRGRYGAATFVVTNIRVATLLQSDAHYSFSPVENTVKQTAGQLYPIGTVCGLTVYVDPLMKASDTRILVGRKGGKDEPGVHFCPYVMAEVVRIITEGTMAPKLMIKSRYALVDAGFYPET